VRRRLVVLMLTGACAMVAADAPVSQIDRGRDWFLHSSKGMACATCHSLEGKGTAVGPDLTRLASVVGPRGLLMTIEMSMTAYVQQFELKNGRKFPGIQKDKTGDILTVFDLSRTPAVEMKIAASEVASQKQNTKWAHPPASAGYTDPELADIIAYLKFASTGVVKEVTVGELH
jgi:putative heme-binding domain-containing protein